MAYRLKRDESIHQAATRIADEELGRAIERLREGGDAHARVHAARRAVKRTRALARLIRAGLGDDEFSRDNLDLRDAARRLSGRRDAAVAADTFTRIVPEPTGALAHVRDCLAAQRDGAAAPDDVLAAAADELARVRARSADWPAFRGDWEVLEPGLFDSYRRGRDAMRAAFAEPTAANFHAWRKRAKDLWYHTLLLQNVWKPVQSAWADALEGLAELLGEDHDLEVLRLALAAVPDLDPAVRDDILARACARSGELRLAAWSLGQRLYAERPRRYVARLSRYWSAWRGEQPRPADLQPTPPEVAAGAAALPLEADFICPGDHA